MLGVGIPHPPILAFIIKVYYRKKGETRSDIASISFPATSKIEI
jgi:hypothetical protein